jgi:prophage tail gpP-like protein
MRDDPRLKVAGQSYGGWTSVRVFRSLERIAGCFALTFPERFGDEPKRRPFTLGAPCTVTLGDEPVIDGYIDRLTIAYDGDGHDVRLEGRDRVGDLVDCSAVHSPDEWHEIGLPELVSILGEPFNVAVTTEPGLDLGRPFARFKVQQGESAFEAVERACRQRAVLPTSDGKGRLLLTRAGRHDMGTLSLGHDIISANAKFSDRKRYSRYIVKGQRPANDRFNGPVATAAVATAEDPNIRRDRPLLLLAEEPGDAEILAQRAKWEATIRAGRARSVAVTLRDWRRDGRLWAPGASVAYSDPFMGLTEAARMIVAKVEFTVSDKTGPHTRLELRSEAAFAPNPLPDLIDQEPGG